MFTNVEAHIFDQLFYVIWEWEQPDALAAKATLSDDNEEGGSIAAPVTIAVSEGAHALDNAPATVAKLSIRWWL